MPSPEFVAALEHFPTDIAVPGDGYEVVRQKFEPAHGHDPGPDIAVEPARTGDVGGVWVARKGEPTPAETIFFVHGGAFVSCPAPSYTFYAAWLVRATGARAFVVDYRLAPEHRFPAALDDCVAAWQGLVGGGVDPGRAAFFGDSCGGGIAITTLLRLRDAGIALPACAVTHCGWFDLEVSGDSARNPVGPDPFVNAEWIRERGRDYLGTETSPRDPLASPIHADLAGLPPLLLQTGQMDTLRDDAVRLAAAAGRAGTGVTLEIWPGMIHGFLGMHGAVPEAGWAVRHVAEFIDHHTR
ncbi:MAG: alpha/beta hydrolase [Myxococcota bacterium]